MAVTRSRTGASEDQGLDPGVNELYETSTHPFLVRIWLEDRAPEADLAIWRGSITHVPSGKRQALRDLDDIVAFIAPYLEAVGNRSGARGRIRRMYKQWKVRRGRSCAPHL